MCPSIIIQYIPLILSNRFARGRWEGETSPGFACKAGKGVKDERSSCRNRPAHGSFFDRMDRSYRMCPSILILHILLILSNRFARGR